jgi:hypothetical protein
MQLYDPSIGSLVHCIDYPALAGVYLRCHRHCFRRLPLIRSFCSQLIAPIPFPRLTGAHAQVLHRCRPPSPSSLTPPPPLRALVEIPFPNHLYPRHVAQSNRRKPLKLPLPSDLAAGDPPRRNTAIPPLLPFHPWPRTSGLKELKAQGAICKA